MSAAERLFPPIARGGTAFLDLSLTTGWAYGHAGDPKPVCGAWELPRTHEDGAAFAALYDVLCDFHEHFEPKRIVAEAPLPPGTTRSNMLTWKCQIGLLAIARLVASQYGMAVREAHVDTVRATVLRGRPWKGKQAHGKPVVMQWCHEQGLQPPDHNAGDAIVGLEFALRTYERRGFSRDLAVA
jgi:hypothetical protein